MKRTSTDIVSSKTRQHAVMEGLWDAYVKPFAKRHHLNSSELADVTQGFEDAVHEKEREEDASPAYDEGYDLADRNAINNYRTASRPDQAPPRGKLHKVGPIGHLIPPYNTESPEEFVSNVLKKEDASPTGRGKNLEGSGIFEDIKNWIVRQAGRFLNPGTASDYHKDDYDGPSQLQQEHDRRYGRGYSAGSYLRPSPCCE